MKVLVLGAGKMIDALLTGLIGQENFSEWGIYSPGGLSSMSLAKKLGAKLVTDPKTFSDPDWILVGCKPQQLKDLKKNLGSTFSETLYVSVLAALSEKDQLDILGAKKLIRLMPNLPVKYGAGVVLMSSTSADTKLPRFEKMLMPLGLIKSVTESELEDLTLLTGSGPAFFYEFAIELSRLSGALTPEERLKLARKVLEGAGEMLKNDEQSLSQHVDAVTSKAGVTIAVLEKWREIQWGTVLKSGFDRGMKRIEEIRESLRRQS